MLATGSKEAATRVDPAALLPSAAALDASRRARLTALLERLATPAAPLDSLPILTGANLAAAVASHPPFGPWQVRQSALIRAGLATAAVPQPVPIAWSRDDLDDEAQLGARALWRAGLRPRGRSSDCLEGGLVTPGTLAISDALDALDALALPVGPITSAAALQRAREVWDIVQPQLLIAAAPTWTFLQDSGEPLPAPGIAVVLTPDDCAALVAPPRAEVYRILSLPQVCTFLAGECAVHDGLHLAEDAVCAEIVDPRNGAAVPDGREGCLLVTGLNRTLAVARFDTGLRGALERGACSCGDQSARLRLSVAAVR